MSNSLLGELKLLDVCPYIVSFPRNEEIHRAMLKKRLMEAGEIFPSNILSARGIG